MGLKSFLKKIFGKDTKSTPSRSVVEKVVEKTVFSETDLRKRLEPSILPFVHIEAEVAENLPLTASKFLGTPYLPAGVAQPLDAAGHPMVMLAQINFAEVPPLKNYPTEGILQFYITKSNDYLYGLDFDDQTNQANFRILYHPIVEDATSLTTAKYIPHDSKENELPIMAEHRLAFSVGEEMAPETDWRSEKFLSFFDVYDDEDAYEKYIETTNSTGHKIGGYAYFTQQDPRSANKYSDYILLLQIDSIGDDILWGDAGVANLFIREEDLIKRDFSKVLYNWDCS